MIVEAAAVPADDDELLDNVLTLICLDVRTHALALDLADELRQALPKHKGIHLFPVLTKEHDPLYSLLDFLLPDILHSFVNDHPGNRSGLVWSNDDWDDHVSDRIGYLGFSLVVALDVVCNFITVYFTAYLAFTTSMV